MSKLKRCPLCNSEFKLDTDKKYYTHPSVGCFFDYLPILVDDEDAIRKWNTRKPMERIVELLEGELKLADVEKRRCVAENMLQFDSAKGYANGIYNAIEIVKEEGGIDGSNL